MMREPLDDAEALKNFLAFVSRNNGPYGSIAYWVEFYLKGVDASGKRTK